MRLEKINKQLTFGLHAEYTRSGFKHTAILFKSDREVCSATCHYINRTWEAYPFDTVKSVLLNKGKNMSAHDCIQVKKFLTRI